MRFRQITLLVTVVADAFAAAKSTRKDLLTRRQKIGIPPPPDPEPVEVIELQLPPAISNPAVGACSLDENIRRTGCMNATGHFQSNSFTADGKHLIVELEFVGAPTAPDPASIFTGKQIVLIKADGTTFKSGDPWKCVTCGIPTPNSVGRNSAIDYPQAFKDGQRILAGTNIIDCGGTPIVSEDCTPEKTRILPIRWNVTPDRSGKSGSMRELRLHPDDVHLGWSSVAGSGQFGYFGRLVLNESPDIGEPPSLHYDLTNVSLLFDPDAVPPIVTKEGVMEINHDAIEIGELRGFSGTGDEITYVGYPWESCNIDLFAVHLQTGKVRRLTAHPEYADPIDISPDDKWMVIEDTRGTNRQMFIAGMRGIPPITDLISTSATSSTRNNGARRFFQPFLLDRYGDRGNYFGQRINAEGDGAPGSINDPNWNAMADPKWSPDGTRIAYHQSLVVSPACGGQNPLPCPKSTAQGGRVWRLMLATLVSRKPKGPVVVNPVPDNIPWATPYVPGSSAPDRLTAPKGIYTLYGKFSGTAEVSLPQAINGEGVGTVAVRYDNFSDDGTLVLNGYENVTSRSPSITVIELDWHSDIVQTGDVQGTKKTSPDGFHLRIDYLRNIFDANGTLTTILDGKQYLQPANGT
ncbi:hypothetical protein H2198_002990 [Neophaeococcomyces mojaviensis]|uniref:Uncharacterized protein n=1 Tax=Neophaeococcomyces mojaviensis TaxID=3383035 RepID=A0ACC3ADC7_9EURO|nr:hypothetical protein H2198_002990 [Knufia sp. JES_112]